MNTKVILVNEIDEPIGEAEKLQAHIDGLLHRAFSVFLFDDEGKMLLQKRADGKYHSAGLWSNACCSHPMPGEATEDAAHRRLHEELGVDVPLVHIGHLLYKAEFDNGLTEHEFDHLFMGKINHLPTPNLDEISEMKFVEIPRLRNDIEENPEAYTEWFKLIMRSKSVEFL